MQDDRDDVRSPLHTYCYLGSQKVDGGTRQLHVPHSEIISLLLTFILHVALSLECESNVSSIDRSKKIFLSDTVFAFITQFVFSPPLLHL